jgi:hypothetical protein
VNAIGGRLDLDALENHSPHVLGAWSPDQLVSLLMFNGLGLVLVVVGYWQAAGLGRTAEQLPWLNLSLLGLIVSGGTNGLWLARGRRMVTLARAAMLPCIPGLVAVPTARRNGRVLAGATRRCQPVRPAPAGPTDALVAGTAMSYYHRPGCLLAAGKEVTVGSRPDHEAAGRRPCEVCQP